MNETNHRGQVGRGEPIRVTNWPPDQLDPVAVRIDYSCCEKVVGAIR